MKTCHNELKIHCSREQYTNVALNFSSFIEYCVYKWKRCTSYNLTITIHDSELKMSLGQADVGDIMTLSHIWGDAGRAHSWWLMRIKEVLFTYYSMDYGVCFLYGSPF